jgi:hypothetical protein
MSRLSSRACAALTCAILALAMASPSASASECSRGYRVCNGSCDQLVQADTRILVCKNRCDLSLIACDKRPASPFTEGDSHFIRAVPVMTTANVAGR